MLAAPTPSILLQIRQVVASELETPTTSPPPPSAATLPTVTAEQANAALADLRERAARARAQLDAQIAAVKEKQRALLADAQRRAAELQARARGRLATAAETTTTATPTTTAPATPAPALTVVSVPPTRTPAEPAYTIVDDAGRVSGFDWATPWDDVEVISLAPVTSRLDVDAASRSSGDES